MSCCKRPKLIKQRHTVIDKSESDFDYFFASTLHCILHYILHFLLLYFIFIMQYVFILLSFMYYICNSNFFAMSFEDV